MKIIKIEEDLLMFMGELHVSTNSDFPLNPNIGDVWTITETPIHNEKYIPGFVGGLKVRRGDCLIFTNGGWKKVPYSNLSA